MLKRRFRKVTKKFPRIRMSQNDGPFVFVIILLEYRKKTIKVQIFCQMIGLSDDKLYMYYQHRCNTCDQ